MDLETLTLATFPMIADGFGYYKTSQNENRLITLIFYEAVLPDRPQYISRLKGLMCNGQSTMITSDVVDSTTFLTIGDF